LQGAQQVRESSLGKYALSIFILPPLIAELETPPYSARRKNSNEVTSAGCRKGRERRSAIA